ncbi:two-component sensor histidine kinase [Paraburkholderia terrae]|uniref:histidine kinase n=1 Tax=Paraburkholderia terrae TaxID=311230 RepID=A0ABM7TI85_9BURK|nr:HAMP domain-containing sensor histidine kinase [Paraburkholderia terrae]BCZ77728.1 two-component sensor histidine kinase [Paraburkholderia terrae]
MNAAIARLRGLWPPRSLFMRLSLIFVAGLLAAQTLSFWLTMTERNEATMHVMVGYIGQEVTSSVALLDRLTPAEREAWLPKLARRSYRFVLGPGTSGGVPPDAKLSQEIGASIAKDIGPQYKVTANAIPGESEHLEVHLTLSDGTPLTIDMHPMHGIPLSPWLPLVLIAQLALLAGCAWLAVRLATRPLERLARAADTLGPDLAPATLPEDGPEEVARASKAFNAMQTRIGIYMRERLQILAAISHDLQTPITRMRIRADLLDDEAERARLQKDLKEMELLVREGVAYARTLHGADEKPRRIDPDALIESMVSDYTDAGDPVSLTGHVGQPVTTRPQALRRILGNLIDNALKYSGHEAVTVEVSVDAARGRQLSVAVLDRGPGIPQELLDAVFQPFYRVESSRNRETGGTGLGLAIAKQLAQSMSATLTLRNREGGGLEARLTL